MEIINCIQQSEITATLLQVWLGLVFLNLVFVAVYSKYLIKRKKAK